ncbi:MAG: chemotaxis protein CheC [Nanobdellota archaeon]
MENKDIAKEIDADMVNEVGNILSNNGANAFAKMIEESIDIKTNIELISTENFIMDFIFTEDFSKVFGDLAKNYVEGYFLKTTSGVEGVSVLLFHHEHIKGLISQIASNMGLGAEGDLSLEQKEEILKEFTSICLNAYLSALSNLIETKISTSMPIPASDILGSLYEFREHLKEANTHKALMIKTEIISDETGITGKLIMLLEPSSLDKIINVLNSKTGS